MEGLVSTSSTLVSTVFGVSHSNCGTPSDTVQSLLCQKRRKKKTIVREIQKANEQSNMWIRWVFLCNTQRKSPLPALLCWKPPVESTHRLCGAVRSPTCWNACADSRCNKSSHPAILLFCAWKGWLKRLSFSSTFRSTGRNRQTKQTKKCFW